MSEKTYGEHYVEFVLGSLDPERTAELERHLKTCEECRTQIAELREVLHSLPLALEPQAPPADLKRRVLEEIAGQSPDAAPVRPFSAAPTPAAPRTGFWKNWAIAATVFAGLAGLIATGLYRAGLQQESQIMFLQSEVARLRESNQGLTLKVKELAAPDVRFLKLAGLAGFESVAGSAFVLPDERRAAVYLHDLPELEADQAYQLWVIEAGRQPRPSNVFRPTGELTELEVELPISADRVAALALTIEPAGGSPSPTGSMVAATG